MSQAAGTAHLRYLMRGTLPVLDRAACAGADPAVFFPEPGRSDEAKAQLAADQAAAVAVCGTCPDRLACRQWALEHDEVGVWGGLTHAERAALRSEPGREAA